MTDSSGDKERRILLDEYHRRAGKVKALADVSAEMERGFLEQKVLNAHANEAMNSARLEKSLFSMWLFDNHDALMARSSSTPADREAVIRECRRVVLSCSEDAYEAAKAKDATDYVAGYQDGVVDADEALRDLLAVPESAPVQLTGAGEPSKVPAPEELPIGHKNRPLSGTLMEQIDWFIARVAEFGPQDLSDHAYKIKDNPAYLEVVKPGYAQGSASPAPDAWLGLRQTERGLVGTWAAVTRGELTDRDNGRFPESHIVPLYRAPVSSSTAHNFDPKRDVACTKGEYVGLVKDARRYEFLRDGMRRMPLGEAGTRHFFDQSGAVSFQEAVDEAMARSARRESE